VGEEQHGTGVGGSSRCEVGRQIHPVEKKDYEVVVSTPYFLAVEISTINEQVVLKKPHL
jgi:hypothetical protein